MCVAAPAIVVSLGSPDGISRPAIVLLDGVERPVDLALVPDVGVGDHVIVHSGFAITALPAEEAAARRELLGRGRQNQVPPGPSVGRTHP